MHTGGFPHRDLLQATCERASSTPNVPRRLVEGAFCWARACYPEVTLNRYALACGFLEAFHGVQKELAPQRSCFRFEYTGIKGLSLILGGGGRAGLRLGPMTGRRYSALRMGSLYSAQSLGLAGIRQGCRKPPKTFPWGTHVIERAFRRGPEESACRRE